MKRIILLLAVFVLVACTGNAGEDNNTQAAITDEALREFLATSDTEITNEIGVGAMESGPLAEISGTLTFPTKDVTNPGPKYKVEITIVYNALSSDEAGKMVRDVLEKHQKACSVDVKVKRGSVQDDYDDIPLDIQWDTTFADP